MPSRAAKSDESNVFSHLWAKYFPYWPVFGFFIVMFGVGAWVYLMKVAPKYESTATLLIKDEKKGIDDSKMIESLNLISTKKIVENEIEVIKSRTLMEEVVNNLGLYAPVYLAGRWRDRALYDDAPLRLFAKVPEKLLTVKGSAFQLDQGKKRVFIDGRAYALNEWVTTPWGVLKFVPTGTVPAANARYYFNLVSPKAVTQDFGSRLLVSSASRLSTVVNLKFQDEVPQRAERILDELVRVYNNAALSDKNEMASNTLRFVDERLAVVGKDLDSIERGIQSYKAQNGAVDISAQSKIFLESVSLNDQKVSNARMQAAVLDQVEQYVLSKNNQNGIVPATLGIEDPVLTQLLTKLYEAELQQTKLRNTVAENNPMLVSITEQINDLKPRILENIRNQRSSIMATKDNLQETNQTYAAMLRAIPQKERDLVEISRQQNITSNIYSFLLQKREEAALSYSSIVSDNRLVDKAESTVNPVSPRRSLIYALAVCLALISGIGVVSGRELLSPKILYRREIESQTTHPIIAEIGFKKSKDPIIIGSSSHMQVSEQFRRLRASLPYLGITGGKGRILLTSTIPGEGKSFVACNLGVSLALAGKKVLLMDFDLVNSSLSRRFNLENTTGISDFLANSGNEGSIIHSSEVHANVFVVPAGSIRGARVEIADNPRLEEFLNSLSKQYDFVIIDSAPVGALSDALVLTGHCDATFYVMRHGYTPKAVIDRLNATDRVTPFHNLSIIYNGVRRRGFALNSQGYGYDNYYFRYSR